MTSVEEQRILIRNSHGENLVGILHATERIPIVTLATALGREGTSAFRFDFAGNGESEGSLMYGNYRREAEDLRAVVQHFRDKERLVTAIVGHSKGGNVVLLYASKYNDVSAVVNISGRFHLEKGMAGRLGKDKQNGVMAIHGSMDKIVPANDALEFASYVQNHKLHIIEGADHEYTWHQDELATVVLDLIKAVCEDKSRSKHLHSCETGANFIKSRI
ncbi:hypothetical protein V6N12_039122 [Hibiscus sabdariffa]|uniref:Serine aminopeptidase S33 domain-containing protein n=1 Tax=Hibiscus sabdariffa TaxID=183260 RepID=A0ABR2DZS6_9ROSI